MMLRRFPALLSRLVLVGPKQSAGQSAGQHRNATPPKKERKAPADADGGFCLHEGLTQLLVAIRTIRACAAPQRCAISRLGQQTLSKINPLLRSAICAACSDWELCESSAAASCSKCCLSWASSDAEAPCLSWRIRRRSGCQPEERSAPPRFFRGPDANYPRPPSFDSCDYGCGFSIPIWSTATTQ
jgi:hypothetical protein